MNGLQYVKDALGGIARSCAGVFTQTPVPLPCPGDVPVPEMIASQDALEEACARWRGLDHLAVDTEFMRVRTFHPRIGLIQAAEPDGRVVCVDPLADLDLAPLARVLEDEGVEKVLHSCAEDLETLHHACGARMRQVFDTQVAAAMLGWQPQAGYQQLVEDVFGFDLPKNETRSDWLARPLSDSQLAYSGLDVAYLLPLRFELGRRLADAGRLEWAREESALQTDPARYVPDPDAYHQRLGYLWQLPRRDLKLLIDLCAWREHAAMNRNVPRGQVAGDAVLRSLVKAKPDSLKALSRVKGFRGAEIRKSGRQILEMVRNARQAEAGDLPEKHPAPVAPRWVSDMVKKLRGEVAEAAEELDLAPEFLAPKRLVKDLVQAVRRGDADPWPAQMAGWRRQAVGERLLARLRTALDSRR